MSKLVSISHLPHERMKSGGPDAPPTLGACLLQWARATPAAPAIAAPGRDVLSFAELWSQIEMTAAALSRMGVGPEDRVALLLPHCAEAAVATLAVSLYAVAAPLDPQAQADELERLLTALVPRLVLFAGTVSGEMLAPLCAQRGLPLVEVVAGNDAPAGCFQLGGTHEDLESQAEAPLPLAPPEDAYSLFLATSGSTGQARFVPLTHRNLAAAELNTRTFLDLTPADRSVNALPLFHGHGLVGGTFGPLSAGSAVCFAGPFGAASFLEALLAFRATWFTAVPSMHQALLAQVPAFREELAGLSLRFLRSGSAPLPPRAKTELEYVFRAPLLNRYGLTEALQLTSESLDPTDRKTGSLGRAAGSEVRAMDASGAVLPPGIEGEIVCRGANVFGGYWQSPDVNAAVFCDGWFRTGDLGFVDKDGHLFLTGRLHERINSGGEKVSPEEVEAVLRQHPGVGDAVVLGIPDKLLGELVGAVVVARSKMAPTAAGLRSFASRKLASAKVPRRILFVDDMPRSATGKPRRREIATRHLPEFERIAAQPPVAPYDATEFRILEIWEALLTHRPLGVEHDFFDCGGNSLTAARLIEQINGACGSDLQPVDLFQATTVRALACLIKQSALGDANARPLVTVCEGSDGRTPFIFVSGDYLGGGLYCHALGHHLPPAQPFHFFAPFDVRREGAPRSIEAHAAAFFQTVKSTLPIGSYIFGGFSHGAYVALELARLAQAEGDTVEDVIVLDMLAPHPQLRWLRAFTDALVFWRGTSLEARQWRFRRLRLEIAYRRARLRGQPGPDRNADNLHAEDSPHLKDLGTATAERRAYDLLAREYEKILRHYVPRAYKGRISVISAEGGAASFTGDPALGWGRVSPEIRTLSVPGSHFELVTKHVADLGEAFSRSLDPGK